MEWFESWFESPYYHILYKNRNDSEAQHFLNNVLDFIQLPPDAHLLDLACGKGRHSIYLNKLGYQVTGADLSNYNIDQASKHASETLQFMRQDMRKPIENMQFDAVFNVFTSFGYFTDVTDNHSVLNAVYSELKPGGIFVLDFLNASFVTNTLVPTEEKEIDGVQFKITRKVENGFIVKHIGITDGDKQLNYQERVQAFTQGELVSMIENAGLKVTSCFGDYDLKPFSEPKSSRIILIANKST